MILVIEREETQRYLWTEIVKTYSSIPVYGARDATEVVEHLGRDVKLVIIGYTDFTRYYSQIKHLNYVVLSGMHRSGPGITDFNFILRNEVVERLPKFLEKLSE